MPLLYLKLLKTNIVIEPEAPTHYKNAHELKKSLLGTLQQHDNS